MVPCMPARLKAKTILRFIILVAGSCTLIFAAHHAYVKQRAPVGGTFLLQGYDEKAARLSPTEGLVRPSLVERLTSLSSSEKLIGHSSIESLTMRSGTKKLVRRPSTKKSQGPSSYFSTGPRDLNSTTAAALPTPRDLAKDCEAWLRKANVRIGQPCPSFPGG